MHVDAAIQKMATLRFSCSNNNVQMKFKKETVDAEKDHEINEGMADESLSKVNVRRSVCNACY